MYIVRNLQAIKWAEAMYVNRNFYSIKMHIVTKSKMVEWLNAVVERAFFWTAFIFGPKFKSHCRYYFFKCNEQTLTWEIITGILNIYKISCVFVPNPKLASRRTVLMFVQATSMR